MMSFLYYLDAQLSISCNVRPLMTALELKYELPCREDLWSAPNANAWNTLLQAQDSSFNEEDDCHGNPEPRPAQGDLYESLMHLIHPDRAGAPLGLLWYSPCAALILVIQLQMMTRELTLASVFLYSNLRLNDNRHNLSVITEENRASIFQALVNLADLIPKPKSGSFSSESGDGVLSNENNSDYTTYRTLWHSVWVAWHYTAMSLTHQDALLTTGIVEYSLPAALSTAWELGKPRAKHHRDIYEDRDVTRVVDNLEQLIEIMNTPPIGSAAGSGEWSKQCIEDPFITLLGFKACMMGWRVVRLMTLGIGRTPPTGLSQGKPSIYAMSTQIVLARIMEAIGSGRENSGVNLMKQVLDGKDRVAAEDYEMQYLDWTDRTFSLRNLWPLGGWMVAVFQETRQEAT